MNVLITGITGFVGSHLCDYILENHPGVTIYGLARWRSPLDNITHILDKVKLCYGDLTDLPSLRSVLYKCKPDYVFHLAAQSEVMYSFVSPVSTLNTNCVGTANLLESIKELKDCDFDPIIHVCSCYDEDTEILTQRGFVFISYLRDDDLIVTIDPDTKNVEFAKYSNKIVQEYSGKMYRIKSRSVDLLITPNHKLLYSKRPTSKLILSSISGLDKRSKRYYFTKGTHQGKKHRYIRIGDKDYNARDVLYLLGLYIGDGYSRTQFKKQSNKSGLSRNDFLEKSRNSKGQFTSLKARGDIEYTLCKSHRVFLSIPDGDKARKPAQECLDRMGVKYSLYKNEIYFSSEHFVQFFDEIGHSALTKIIPLWVFEFDASLLQHLFKGLIDSDGYYHQYGGERFITSSRKLADGFTVLCTFLGKFCTYSVREGISEIKGRKIVSSPSFVFSISDNTRMISNSNITSVNYKGKIWCLEIPKTHNFLVRRNGKTVFCGNSSECYGQVTEAEIPITEDCPLRPASPYAVSKVCEDMLAYQYHQSWGLKTIRTRMFTHSISYDSPIIVKDSSGTIDIVPISDIRKAREKVSQEFWDFEDRHLEVWDGQKFTKILNMSAHRLNGHKLLQLITGGGIVQVTNNHSVFNADDEVVDAGTLKVNDKIAVKDMPKPDFQVESITEEFAWLLGFLVAEGCVKSNRRICFSNKDPKLINKCKNNVLRAWGKSCSIYEGSCSILSVLGAAELSRLLDGPKSDFSVYTRCSAHVTSKRYKRVPKVILNSSRAIQKSFLDGYNDGDGRKNPGLRSNYQEFKTSSSVLACGLAYLINNMTGQIFTLNCEDRLLSNGKVVHYYSVNLRSNSDDLRKTTGKCFCKERNIIKKIQDISIDYSEMVYDIETESHAFSCGIGSIKVHNTGPRRGWPFVASNFAKQIAEIEKIGSGTVRVGNLSSVRTFADVRDTVRAYWLLMEKCTPGEAYNIGGSETMTVGEMLDKLKNLSSANVSVEVDPSRLRPSDVTLQIPCCDKFKKETGWEPRIPFDQTLEDMLNYWRLHA